jgi:hypothetical protein
VTGQWFYAGTPDSSINKTDCQDITEILLKVALSTISQTKPNNRRQPSLINEQVQMLNLPKLTSIKIKTYIQGIVMDFANQMKGSIYT